MLIDTHCHLDAREFDADRDTIVTLARQAGVSLMVVPAVEQANFLAVQQLAGQHRHVAPALGIHPMYVAHAQEEDLQRLADAITQMQATGTRAVAIGEIGLDFFAETQKIPANRALQEYYFVEQLKLARQWDLPVILHVRRAVDEVLKHLRRIRVCGGIAHAFNGSRQQADEFIKLGFKLGFGGAMTYSRALKIRDLAVNLPLEAIVLETDSPDIPPEWLGSHGRNSPAQLLKIAEVFAQLRGLTLAEVAEFTTKNALQALPKLLDLYTPAQVVH